MSFDQTLQTLLEAIQHRDLDQFLATVSIGEDVSFILPNGALIEGRAAFINLNTAWFADPDWQMDVKVLRTIETPEMAFALMLADYKDATIATEPYAKQHYFSLVFTKKDGGWVLIHDQTSVVQ